MSFIGPRPDLPEHLKEYIGDEIRKLEVRPGISGYSQAYYRNSIEWKERIKNDIYYIDDYIRDYRKYCEEHFLTFIASLKGKYNVWHMWICFTKK